MNEAPIDRVLGLVLELAGGNLDARLEPAGRKDPLDGVVEGLNMLAEELSASTDALKRSEESFRTLLEHLPDAILVHRDQRIVYANRAALSLLGYATADQMLDRQIETLLDFNENPQAELRARALGASQPAPAGREGRLRHRSGSTIEAELLSVPINFQGRPAQLSVARDISARKELTAKMMEMDRMIAVGTLAAGVGHEINNPLAYVISNLEFALDTLAPLMPPRALAGPSQPPDLKALREALEEAREGSERVRKIVHDLKAYSRVEAEEASIVDIETPLESAISMSFNEIRHRARLVRDYQGGSLVHGNASRLGQVFLNLLVNAAHAIPEGAASEHRITVRYRSREGRVVVEVEDTGPGIDEQHLPRVFDPFFTTKPVGQGTGLGLFIVKRIVRQHTGELHVESAPGKGSLFRVSLPSATERISEVRAASRGGSDRGPRAKVLVIDDEPSIGRSLARVLGREHDVTVLTSARSALSHLEGPVWYDVILCDVMMPDMTGVDLFNALLSERAELAERMLFFTGGAFTPSTQAFVHRMQHRCLTKPLDVSDVRKRVSAWTAPERALPPTSR